MFMGLGGVFGKSRDEFYRVIARVRIVIAQGYLINMAGQSGWYLLFDPLLAVGIFTLPPLTVIFVITSFLHL